MQPNWAGVIYKKFALKFSGLCSLVKTQLGGWVVGGGGGESHKMVELETSMMHTHKIQEIALQYFSFDKHTLNEKKPQPPSHSQQIPWNGVSKVSGKLHTS